MGPHPSQNCGCTPVRPSYARPGTRLIFDTAMRLQCQAADTADREVDPWAAKAVYTVDAQGGCVGRDAALPGAAVAAQPACLRPARQSHPKPLDGQPIKTSSVHACIRACLHPCILACLQLDR